MEKAKFVKDSKGAKLSLSTDFYYELLTAFNLHGKKARLQKKLLKRKVMEALRKGAENYK